MSCDTTTQLKLVNINDNVIKQYVYCNITYNLEINIV